MTTEELLMPRIKVIAPAPLMKNEVGSLLRAMYDGSEYSFGIKTVKSIHFYSLDEFKQWPYIFKICEWWENREIEEMPEYVKIIKTKPSYGLEAGCVREVTQWEKGKVREWVCDLFPIYASIEDLEPATPEEYQQYTNKIQ